MVFGNETFDSIQNVTIIQKLQFMSNFSSLLNLFFSKDNNINNEIIDYKDDLEFQQFIKDKARYNNE